MQRSDCRTSTPRSLLQLGDFPVLIICLALGLATTGCDSLPGFGDSSPPNSPSGLNAASGDASIALEWNAVQAEDLAGYNVYRSTSTISSVSGTSPINGESPVSDTSYTDDTAENGTLYHYVVTAVDEAENESDPSGEVEKTAFAEPPNRP